MFNRGPTSDTRPPDPQSQLQDTPAILLPSALPTSSLATPDPVSPTAQVAGAPSDALAKTTGQISIIGADLVILGEKITVITKDRLQIDGEVRGDVTGQAVVVGKTGKVTGTVAANAIEVHGHVIGAVKAHHVTLHETAQVDGDIYNQVLRIAEGAIFDGRVRRPKDPKELIPNLDIASFAVPKPE